MSPLTFLISDNLKHRPISARSGRLPCCERVLITLNESSSRLSHFQMILNRPEILPDRAFRREDPIYQLVSYVNNVTGLLLSSNFDGIPNLVARACEHIREFPAKTERRENYYSVVSNYLSHTIFHLESFANGSISFDETRIGEDVLRGGPKQAPELGSERDSRSD